MASSSPIQILPFSARAPFWCNCFFSVRDYSVSLTLALITQSFLTLDTLCPQSRLSVPLDRPLQARLASKRVLHLIRSTCTSFHGALHAGVDALLRRLAREVDGVPHGHRQRVTNPIRPQRRMRVRPL